MVIKKGRSLKQLQIILAREKAKARIKAKRAILEGEIIALRRSRSRDARGRIGRGFGILTKKTKTAIVKQARLIRERQLEDERRKTKKRGGGRFDFDPLGEF